MSRLCDWLRCRLWSGHWWVVNLQFGTKQCLICHRLADSYALDDRPAIRY